MRVSNLIRSCLRAALALAILVFVLVVPNLRAQAEDFDQYKLRFDLDWFYSSPTGSIKAQSDTVPIALHSTLDFSNYSTFAGKADWKFTRKNHFYVVVIPLESSKTATLSRSIVWSGNPITAGAVIHSDLHVFEVAPGYQRDIVRRKRGHLGVAVQINLFDSSAKISAAAQVTATGVHQAAVSAGRSLLAPLPVGGPEGRFYLTNSPRVFIEGNFYGMYFFGYGRFYSSTGDLGITFNRHLNAKAGYFLGTDLLVKGTSDRFGLNLTQKGPLVGLQFSF
jgi:hypothetical protein